MKYKVSVIKKIAFLVMTMALAVALVACQGAAGVAGAPGEPGAPALLPPLKVGEIADKALTVGDDASTTALSGYFSDAQGQTLTYTAKSSMTAYATAEVDKMTLTVTAVAAGESTITVTATDTDKLMAVQTFMVTVTAATATPTEPPTPTTPTGTGITISDAMAAPLDITSYLPEGHLAKDYKVVPSNTAVFTVSLKKGAVWNITAVSRGTAKADIRNKNTAASVGMVTVTVENRAPAIDTTKGSTEAISLSPPGMATGNKGTIGHGADKLMVYKQSVSVVGYFKDPDAADNGALTFTFTPSRRDVKITKGSPCTSDPCALEFDVVEKDAANFFNMQVVASDSGGLQSATLDIPVNSNAPLSQTYETDQYRTSFRSLTVEHREATHDLRFANVGGTSIFLFVDEHIKKLVTAMGTEQNKPPLTAGTFGSKAPATKTTAPTDNVNDIIVMSATGAVLVVPGLVTIDADDGSSTAISSLVDNAMSPVLGFSTRGTGSGTIKLTHYMWIPPYDHDDDVDTDMKVGVWGVSAASVSIKVVSVP